jgi:hypothetical protein
VFKGQGSTTGVWGRVCGGLVQVGERLRVLPGDETAVVKGQPRLFSLFDLSARTRAGSYRDGIGQGTVGCRWFQRYPVSDCGRSHSPRRGESVVLAECPCRACFSLHGADYRFRHSSANPSRNVGEREN